MTSSLQFPLEKAVVAPCPYCQEFIDSTSETCRFCHRGVYVSEIKAKAELNAKLAAVRSARSDMKAIAALLMTGVSYLVFLVLDFWFSPRVDAYHRMSAAAYLRQNSLALVALLLIFATGVLLSVYRKRDL